MPRRKAPRLHSGLPREDCAGCTPQDQDEIRRGRIGALKAMTGYGADLETYDFSEPLSAAQSAGEREAKPTAPPGPRICLCGYLVPRARRSRGSFPTGDAAPKLVCLAIRRFKKGGRNGREWSATCNQFTIMFGERFDA